MPYRHALLPLILTSSLFLVHCSGGDDDSQGNAGAGATGGTTGGSTGTGGNAAGSGGTTSGAGMPGSGGSSTTGGSSNGAGQGGVGGTAVGHGGSGGMPSAGRGGTAGGGGSSAGGAGKAGAGTGGTPMGGMGGSAGSGTGMSGMGGAVGAGSGGKAGNGAGGSGGSGGFTLTSKVLTDGGMFPDMNTCASTSDSSPDLSWTAGPSGTLSYALILLDTSNSLDHWVIWDIPSTVTSLPAMLDSAAMLAMPAGAKQKAIQGNGYFGPCPSGSDHLYKFTVYALPVATLSGATTSAMTSALAMAVMNANPLASASLSSHSSATRAN